MKNQKIKSVICTTNELSDTAQEVVKYLGESVMEHRQEALRKDYPMVKCNVSQHSKEKLLVTYYCMKVSGLAELAASCEEALARIGGDK